MDPSPHPDQVGLCTVRIWRYGDDVVMRVRLCDDTADDTTERVVLTVDVEETASAVRDFLHRFRDAEAPRT